MLELLDYRRTVFDLYSDIRRLGTNSAEAYHQWVSVRNQLFAEHSQSALDEGQKATFSGLSYWDYQSDYCVHAELDRDVEAVTYDISAGNDGTVTIRQIGQVKFDVATGQGSLGVFWIEGYGGGIFIPFKDATNNKQTYGGGRYLYDTIKGADLGSIEDTLVLDFNYSYHPSCYYNHRWICPLAPQQNRLDIAIQAGEQMTEIVTT
ncbi:MAG: hypothetical protein Phog2KO_05180 [Phototrophicaceae bacterium]